MRSAISLISQGMFMGSLDLKDAYFLIPVIEDHRKFLRFKFGGKIFQFLCLPFGLSISPYIFTKIMKPVINMLSLQGIILNLYLDDFLFIDKSKIRCEINMKRAIMLLEYLGFIINYQKSCLIPSQKCKY